MAQSLKNAPEGEVWIRQPEIRDPEPKLPEEMPLKGTFVSVMLLGAFLVATWVTVFVIYLHRK